MYLPAWQFDNTLNMHYMVYLTGSDLNNYNRWTFDVNLWYMFKYGPFPTYFLIFSFTWILFIHNYIIIITAY